MDLEIFTYRYVVFSRPAHSEFIIERHVDEKGSFTLVETQHKGRRRAMLDFLNRVQPEQFSIVEDTVTEPRETAIFYSVAKKDESC